MRPTPAQLSDIYERSESHPSTPELWFGQPYGGCPLTKVFPVLYEQLFNSNQWWTTQTYTFSRWEKTLQATSATLPDNTVDQGAQFQASDVKYNVLNVY